MLPPSEKLSHDDPPRLTDRHLIGNSAAKLSAPRGIRRTPGEAFPSIRGVRPRRVRAQLLLLAALWLACRSLPEALPPVAVDAALAPAASGPLARVERSARPRIGEGSGFLLLDRNDEALRWRLALADTAVRSLDVQSYAWYGDAAGLLVLERLLAAADRGVRVRLLVDDLLLFDADADLAAIDAHPNVEVRVFNPWRERSGGALGRAVEFLARTEQLNTRMHNKLIVADNRVAICGGRNLGDEYFGLNPRYSFHDVDLLAVGPISRSLSAVFDLYWNADTVVEAARLGPPDAARLERMRRETRATLRAAPRLSGFSKQRADWSEWLRALPSRLHAGRGRPIYDAPVPDGPDGGSAADLRRMLETAQRDILVSNAYWVPTPSAIEWLHATTGRGVRIRVLTNSLGSHDVPAVNGAYKNWRRAILGSGTELYELRHDAAIKTLQDTPPVVSGFVGLHAKAFVVDTQQVYVGSHNLDPRSRDINMELGIHADSRGLAEELTGVIERDMQGENSWQVRLDDEGDLVWEAQSTRLGRQPARSAWQRVADAFFGLLPIEDQL